MKRVIEDITPQVDVLQVWDNGELHDYGDAAKFLDHEGGGYHLTIDDDLYYPKDYVERILYWIDALDAPVSFHGRRLDLSRHPWDSYFTAHEWKGTCLGRVDRVEKIDIPGTGVFGYHSRHMYFDVPFPNGFMADIWAGVQMYEAGVKCYCVPHHQGWIRHQEIDLSQTLHAKYFNNDAVQTQVINAYYSDGPQLPEGGVPDDTQLA